MNFCVKELRLFVCLCADANLPTELVGADLAGVDLLDESRPERMTQAIDSKEQKLVYVAKFAASKDWNLSEWSAAQFSAALAANPDMAGLASSPLTLFMVLTILPSISVDVDDQVTNGALAYTARAGGGCGEVRQCAHGPA